MSARTGLQRQHQRLALPVGQRQGEVLAAGGDLRRRDSACRTICTYSAVRPIGSANRTPCQPSDTCGPDTPEARAGTGRRTGRPGWPRSSRSSPACGRGSAAPPIRCRSGGPGGDRGQHGHRIRPVGLGRPDAVEAESIGGTATSTSAAAPAQCWRSPGTGPCAWPSALLVDRLPVPPMPMSMPGVRGGPGPGAGRRCRNRDEPGAAATTYPAPRVTAACATAAAVRQPTGIGWQPWTRAGSGAAG